MKILDLFSGIGGFSLAFDRAGFETVAFSEIEPFPSKVLAHHWPHIPNLGSVTDIDGAEVRERFGHIDLVTFGSPCQDWSVAGKRLGLEGQRSSLFHEAIRIIRGVRSTFAVFENVPGLFSAAEGWNFAAVLDEMAESGALDIAWSVLDAQWFGVPQRRRRIFLIADFRGERAGEILFESESVSGNIEKSGEAGEETTIPALHGFGSGGNYRYLEEGGMVAGTLGGGSGARGWASDTDRMTFIPEVSHSLSAHQSGQRNDPSEQTFVASIAGNAIGREPENGPQRGDILTDGTSHSLTAADRHAVGPVCFSSQDNGRDAGLDLAPTLRLGTGLDIPSPPAVAFALRGREDGAKVEVSGDATSSIRGADGGSSRDYVASPITASYGKQLDSSDTGKGPPNAIISNMAVRRLTPKECERLQGFPDDWTNIPGSSDSARYRALGNSIAVPVVYWIAERMIKVVIKKEAA